MLSTEKPSHLIILLCPVPWTRHTGTRSSRKPLTCCVCAGAKESLPPADISVSSATEVSCEGQLGEPMSVAGEEKEATTFLTERPSSRGRNPIQPKETLSPSPANDLETETLREQVRTYTSAATGRVFAYSFCLTCGRLLAKCLF